MRTSSPKPPSQTLHSTGARGNGATAPVPSAPTVSDRGPCSTGHLVVRQLEREGVERIYCVPGESYLDVLDGLHDSPIRVIVNRQEGGAGYMAVAEGRMTGLPGVVMVTRGPGAANVLVSAHTAFQDATPLVIFVGLIPSTVRGREAFQEFDLHAWFGSTVKKVLMLDNPHAAAEVVAHAMHTARSGRPGPVVIGLPEETQLVETDGRTATPRRAAEPGPSADDLLRIDSAIEDAERPVLVVGGEMWDGPTSSAIATWATSRGLGIIADFRAYDGIDHRSDHFLGVLGNGSAPVTRRIFADADLQIFLGCVRSDMMTGTYESGCAPGRTIVIGPDPDAHGHFGPLDDLIVSTTRAFGTAVNSLAPVEAAVPAWAAAARREFSAWRVAPRLTGQEDPDYVDMDVAFGSIQRLLPDDVLITYGAGNHSGWALRYLPVRTFPSVLAPRNGSMGFGVPAAVAASLVHPERKVFSIAGDGCFMMNGQELSTAVNEGTDITIVINDNSIYGTIVAHQERHYPGRPSGTHLANPDFAALARSFGAFGVTVQRTDEFEPAFAQALAHPGPAIVHALTSPAVRTTRSPESE